jgi:hypothetical protein
MALATFHFEATLPADEAFLEPLIELVRQAFLYTGTPEAEAGALAQAMLSVVEAGLKVQRRGEPLRFCLERRGGDAVIELSGPLPASAPPGVLADVDIRRDGARTVYRLTRAVADV